jgi:hypothetical protein
MEPDTPLATRVTDADDLGQYLSDCAEEEAALGLLKQQVTRELWVGELSKLPTAALAGVFAGLETASGVPYGPLINVAVGGAALITKLAQPRSAWLRVPADISTVLLTGQITVNVFKAKGSV